jgi:hypothetical protein
MMKRALGVVLGLVLTGLTAGLAEARPARCFTTDDGHYPCDFRPLDRKGSFSVSAPMKPGFTLWVERAGRGSVSANFGQREVGLPGIWLRRADDPACWQSDATGAVLCVW